MEDAVRSWGWKCLNHEVVEQKKTARNCSKYNESASEGRHFW